MSKQYRYPAHIRSRLLDDLLVYHKLRDGDRKRLTAAHVAYLNRLRDHYAQELDYVSQLRKAAFTLLTEFAATVDENNVSVSENDLLAYVSDQVGPSAVLTLALSNSQCVLIFASQERDKLRAEQDGAPAPEPVFPSEGAESEAS